VIEDGKLTQSFDLEAILMGEAGRLHILGMITPHQKRFQLKILHYFIILNCRF
jgi:hypothetical protein